MRWENLAIAAPPSGPTLPLAGAVARTFDTPGFQGMTFYEVQAKSVLNKVPEASRVPFRWTVNPYRGCSHACVYCFARRTHTYLDLGAGHDFDTKIIVKVNAAERLRAELASPRWEGDHVALGTNVDPYQRAEGRYRLMPGIIKAFRDAANPFSVLTKGTLVLRDLDLFKQAARVTDVSVAVSVGFVDQQLWRLVEPGTPNPHARLSVCRTFTEAGLGCSVLMAPVLPYLTDSDESLEETVRAVAAAGASRITPIVLHLRPGAREWYFEWLRRHFPHLVPNHERLYGRGSYAPKSFQQEIASRVTTLAERHGIGQRRPSANGDRRDGAAGENPGTGPGGNGGAERPWRVSHPAPTPAPPKRAPEQLVLL